MNNEEKQDIILNYLGLIHSIQKKYRISGFTYEELNQELLTHLCEKLDVYDENKSELTTFISLVVKNKLNNLFNNKRNVREYAIGGKEEVGKHLEEINYSPIEKIALSHAKEKLNDNPNKEIISELLMGKNQTQVADEYQLSREWVNKIWMSFIKSIREEVL